MTSVLVIKAWGRGNLPVTSRPPRANAQELISIAQPETAFLEPGWLSLPAANNGQMLVVLSYLFYFVCPFLTVSVLTVSSMHQRVLHAQL